MGPYTYDEQDAEAQRKALRCLGSDEHNIETSFLHYLYNAFGRNLRSPKYYLYKALAYTVRDRLMARWKQTWLSHYEADTKRAYYLSMEFLIGRSLSNNLFNLGIDRNTGKALYEF